MELPMTIWAKRPNFVRSESVMQGNSIIAAYGGTTVWTIKPLTCSPDPQKVDEKMAASLTSSDMNSSIGSLAAFKAAGQTVGRNSTSAKDELTPISGTGTNGAERRRLSGMQSGAPTCV